MAVPAPGPLLNLGLSLSFAVQGLSVKQEASVLEEGGLFLGGQAVAAPAGWAVASPPVPVEVSVRLFLGVAVWGYLQQMGLSPGEVEELWRECLFDFGRSSLFLALAGTPVRRRCWTELRPIPWVVFQGQMGKQRAPPEWDLDWEWPELRQWERENLLALPLLLPLLPRTARSRTLLWTKLELPHWSLIKVCALPGFFRVILLN